MKKYRILIATQYPMDTGRPHGGVESVSVNLVRGLAKFTDFEVIVVTLNKEVNELRIETIDNASIHRLPKTDSSELANCIYYGKQSLTSYVSNLKPDLIHMHDVYGMMLGGLNVPSVFTVHGFIFEDTRVSNRKFSYVRSLIWKMAETKGWNNQKNIISISPYVREKLKGFTNARIYDIDNPISDVFFNLDSKKSKTIFFSAAVISPRKNTEKLVRSFERLLETGVEAELRLAGRIVNQTYGAGVMDRIEKSKHKDSIIYLGELSSEQIRRQMSESSVFVLISREENSPMGIEEAMAAGLPVITSNRCGMPYMVRHGESGYLVDPEDEREVADRMGVFASNADIMQKMSAASKKIAMDRFHPAQVSSKTRDVYLEIMQRERVI
jgi:glycosyltransferase involved in cell wall biosynthesis